MILLVKRLGSKWILLAQQELGLDVVYFIKGGLFIFLQQVVGLTCGLVLTYMFGHFTSKATLGEYNLLISITSIAALISIPGISTSLMRATGEGFLGSLVKAVKTRWLWSILGLPLLLIVGSYYQSRGEEGVAGGLRLAALLFPWLYSFQVYQPFFIGLKKFNLQAAFAILSSILTTALVSLAILTDGSSKIIFVAFSLGSILPAVAGFIYAHRLTKKNKTSDPDLLPYGYFLTGLQVLPTAVGHFSQILLAGFLGVEGLAIFSVVTRFQMMVQKNLDVFFKPVTAKLAQHNQQQHKRVVNKHLLKFVIMGLGLFLGLWLTTPWLVNFFYGHSYQEAIGPARWYALMVLPLPVAWLFNDIITFQKERKVKTVLNTVLPLLQLVAYPIIIPKWQIMGVVVIMLAERYISLAVMGWYIWRKR